MNEKETITWDQVPRFEYRLQNDIGARDQYERDVSSQPPPGQSFAESTTIQSFAQDADINVMVKRFGISDYAVPPRALDPSYFGDFTQAPVNLQDALARVQTAEQHFQALPADLRAKFQNDSRNLWQWINDPRNTDEAVKLGLLARQEEPAAPPQTPPPDTK